MTEGFCFLENSQELQVQFNAVSAEILSVFVEKLTDPFLRVEIKTAPCP
jgi:hypothetical protein